MAYIDFAQRTITVNIVYFGAMRSGCATNVRQLHRVQPSRQKSELQRDAAEGKRERVWHFTYRSNEQPKIPGFETFVRCSSIPSGADLSIDRTSYVSGVDAVVFVADARANRVEDNHAALLDLEQVLASIGLNLSDIPILLQVNHTDAANARPTSRVLESVNPMGFPVYEAVARQGTGILATHDAVLAAAFTRLRDNLANEGACVTLTHLSRAQREHDEDAILAHVASLPAGIEAEASGRSTPPTAEIILRPRELRDGHPIHLVRSELRDQRLRLETVVRRDNGSDRKLAFVIETGGEPDVPDPEPRPITTTSSIPPVQTVRAAADYTSLLPIVAGTIGGFVLGILISYLYF